MTILLIKRKETRKASAWCSLVTQFNVGAGSTLQPRRVGSALTQQFSPFYIHSNVRVRVNCKYNFKIKNTFAYISVYRMNQDENICLELPFWKLWHHSTQKHLSGFIIEKINWWSIIEKLSHFAYNACWEHEIFELWILTIYGIDFNSTWLLANSAKELFRFFKLRLQIEFELYRNIKCLN